MKKKDIFHIDTENNNNIFYDNKIDNNDNTGILEDKLDYYVETLKTTIILT